MLNLLRANVLLLAGWLLGCQTGAEGTLTAEQPHQRIGSGPVELQEPALRLFSEYLQLERPLGFAIVTDGSNGSASFCPVDRSYLGSCTNFREIDAVFACEQTHGAPCQLFALGREIVWENPGDWAGDSRFGRFVAAATSIHPSSNFVEVYWGGEMAVGSVHLREGAAAAHFSVILESDNPCHGEMSVGDSEFAGFWGLICRDGVTAQGQVFPESNQSDSENRVIAAGWGTDTNGQPLEFRIFAQAE